jgi:predicted Zn-dependent protease
MAVLYGASPKMPREPAAPILYRTYLDKGVPAAVRQFGELSDEKNGGFDLTWQEIDRLGKHLLGKKKTADAIEIFKLNVDSSPHQANVYLGLADAYRQAGNRKLAVQNYAKALELNPDWSDLIADRLKRLQTE